MKASLWIHFLNLLPMTTAAGIVAITDMPGYAPLAQCARNGLYSAIFWGAYNQCPTGITPLQSCVCTKGNNLNAFRNTVTTSVEYHCSLAGSEDLISAVSVYNDYCNQNGPLPAQPTTTTKAGGVGGLSVSPSTAASPGSSPSVSEQDTETNTPKQTSSETPSTTFSSTPTTTPTPVPIATNGVPIAAVAGGAVAFVALMVSSLIAFFCYRRNNRHKMKRLQQSQQTTVVGPVAPLRQDTQHIRNDITHNQSFTSNIHNIHNTTTNNTPVLEHSQNMKYPSLHSLNHQQHTPPFSSSPQHTTQYIPGIDYTNQSNRLIEPARTGSSHPSLQNQLPQYQPQQHTPQSQSPSIGRRPVARPSPRSRNDYEVEEM